MRYLITGANGFIGRHLAAHLRERGDALTALVRNADPGTLAALDCELVIADILDREAVRRVFTATRPEIIFHLAGEIRGLDLSGFTAINVTGTENVLAAAMEAGSAVVLPGSAAELGMPGPDPVDENAPAAPLTPYGISKAAQVRLGFAAAESGLRVTIARLFTVIGRGQESRYIGADLAARVAALDAGKGERLRVQNPAAVRDFLDVRDVCRALELIAKKGTPGQVYNVCSGRGLSFRELAAGFLAVRGLPDSLIDDGEPDPAASPCIIGDPAKIKAELGWQPEHDLRSTLAWMME